MLLGPDKKQHMQTNNRLILFTLANKQISLQLYVSEAEEILRGRAKTIKMIIYFLQTLQVKPDTRKKPTHEYFEYPQAFRKIKNVNNNLWEID